MTERRSVLGFAPVGTFGVTADQADKPVLVALGGGRIQGNRSPYVTLSLVKSLGVI
jgi:hypothetical protein